MQVSNDIGRMYERLYEQYGDDARSFLHNDQASQYERFDMLTRCLVHEKGPFSVHEIGCSVGHGGDFLADCFPVAEYSGSDVSELFVRRCRSRLPGRKFFVRDITERLPDDRYDFLILNGTFNIPPEGFPREDWQSFIYAMMNAMYAMCQKGIAVNFLTTYYDPGREHPHLHYQDEKAVMDYTVRNLSRHFELDSKGPLYEYAVRIYRPEYIRQLHENYRTESFARYLTKKE
jgi:hypothetical protein